MAKVIQEVGVMLLLAILCPIICLSQESENMPDSTIYFSKKKFANLIEQTGYQILQEYSDESFDAYLMEDGRLFLKDVFGGEATMYESLDHYLAVIRAFEEKFRNRRSFHVLTDYQSSLDSLVNNHPEIIRKYLRSYEKLDLKADSSVFSLHNFDKVDELISAQRKHDDYLERNFIPIVAIVGAALIDRTQGKWILQPSKTDSQIIEPYILGADGKKYNPWLNAFKILVERYPIYLESLILGEITDL